MKYAVNEEGIEAMNTMASAITESVEELEGYTTTVQSAADEYEDTLGPHKASLDEALSEITESVKQAAEHRNRQVSILDCFFCCRNWLAYRVGFYKKIKEKQSLS